MPPKKTYRKTLTISIMAFLVLFVVMAGFGAWYYLERYSRRSPYPAVTSTLDEQSMKDRGYFKLQSDDKTYSFYVPFTWTLIDGSIGQWGDFLNGSNAFMRKYPNSFGIMTESVCQSMGQDSLEKLKDLRTYDNFKFESSNLKTMGDYRGCLTRYSGEIKGKDYHVNQFFVSREKFVYVLFEQHPGELPKDSEISDTMLSSMVLSE